MIFPRVVADVCNLEGLGFAGNDLVITLLLSIRIAEKVLQVVCGLQNSELWDGLHGVVKRFSSR